MINVGFIGAGNMGFAIIKGIAESDFCDNYVKMFAYSTSINLYAFDVDNEKVQKLSKYGVLPCESANEIFEKCKYVFLAVKPQQLDDLLESVKSSVSENHVIVSICAGITGDYIKSRTIPNAKVVLVMPNTPILLNEGATALSKVEPCNEEEFSFVRGIFETCGIAEVVSENQMKEIIAINGSSPAFIYLFAKAFVDYAVSVGINENVAKSLFAKSLSGSSKMITDSGYSLEELITMVSSKGGTTIAGLEKLREGNLEDTVKKCCEACTKRAYELSK